MWVLMNSCDEYYSERFKGAVTDIIQAKQFDSYSEAKRYQDKIENTDKPEFHSIVKLKVSISEVWNEGC